MAPYPANRFYPCLAATRGNTLLEYGLIGSCVLVVAITAMMLLGINLNTTMAQLDTEYTNHVQATQLAQLYGGNTQGSIVRVTLSDGAVIHVPGYPENLAEQVASNGVSNTTSMLSGFLKNLAQTMQANGEITAEQAAQLIKAADQAHDIAMRQQMLEQLATYSPDFYAQTMVYGDKTYSATSLAQTFDADTKGTQALLANFTASMQQAQKEGNMPDPILRQMLDELSNNMIQLSNSYANAIEQHTATKDLTSNTSQSLTKSTGSLCADAKTGTSCL